MTAIQQPGGASSGSPIIIGTNLVTGELVKVDASQLSRGTVVIGKMGSGKTTLLVQLMLEGASKGWGVIFLDVHGDATETLLDCLPSSRLNDVILVDILDSAYAPGLNLVACANPHDKTQVSYVISGMMDVMSKLFSESQDLLRDSPYMAEVLQNTLPVFIANTNPKLTIAEFPLFFRNPAIRSRLLKQVTNPYVLDFWRSFERLSPKDQEERVGSTIRRIENFLIDSLVSDIVSQATTTIPLRRIMDESKILLVKLSRNHSLLTQLIGSVLVQQINAAAFSRVDMPQTNRKHCLLVCDEFQNFDTPSFRQLLTEGRKYGLSTVVGFQALGQLSHASRVGVETAANLIAYQVSPVDAETIAGEFTVASSPTESGVLTANILQTLLQDGHPSLTDYIQRWLRPLQAARGESEDEINMTRTEISTTVYPNIRLRSSAFPAGASAVYRYAPSEMKKALVQFGDWLYNCVRDPHASLDIPAPILRPLSFVLCCSNYWTCLYAAPTPLIAQALQQSTTLLSQRKTHGKSEEEYENQLHQASLLFKVASMMYFDDLLNAQQSKDVQCSEHGFVFDGTLSKQGNRELATELFESERAAHDGFTYATKRAITILREQPLFVSSPAKYGYQSRGDRPISDRQAEIAQALVHPVKPYTARARIGTVEVPALQVSLPHPSGNSAPQRARIRASNIAAGYLKRREDIEREIAQRHQQLNPSFLPILRDPVLPAPQGDPYVSPSVQVSEVEPDDLPPPVQYTQQEQAHIERFTRVNGVAPSFLPMRETEQERFVRVFTRVNGYAPSAELLSRHVQRGNTPPQTSVSLSAQGAKPTPQKNTTRKKDIRKPTQPKRTKQEDEEL